MKPLSAPSPRRRGLSEWYDVDMTRSPFPGMDPYLEAHWPDIHGSLVFGARDALNGVLPEDLAARSEERVAVEASDVIETSDAEEVVRTYRPDVRVIEPLEGGVAIARRPVASLTGAPYRLSIQAEPATERSILIAEIRSERLVTVIEFISPSTKRKPGLDDFRSKRAEMLESGVNWVEIDLVREGNWQALLLPHRCPEELITTYRAIVRVPGDPAGVGIYPIRLQDKLPEIVIPLRASDPPTRMALQPLLDAAYSNGRYGRTTNYTRPCDPPLEGDELRWGQELLANTPR